MKIIPSEGLELWFDYLRKLQAACSINTNVSKMDLLTFANTKISTVLPTTTEQNAFIVAAQNSPGFDFSIAELSQYSTFEGLLDHYNPLPTYVGVFLQSLAADPFPGGAVVDFWNAATTAAFPGGSNGAKWQTAVGRLTSVMPGVCFTSALQAKVAQTIDKAQTKMSDVINQIAVLG